jgi:hypothetical protein
LLGLLLAGVLAACSGFVDWNPGGIDWVDYERGVERAAREQKPILLFVYTEWCPYCKRLSRYFGSDEVEREAREYVMVRVDADRRPDLSDRFAPDGAYIPRVLLLRPDGTPDYEFVLSAGRHRYSISSDSDAHLLWTLRSARERHRRPPAEAGRTVDRR